jgi:uncharacterized RDD family membrane protein YckC
MTEPTDGTTDPTAAQTPPPMAPPPTPMAPPPGAMAPPQAYGWTPPPVPAGMYLDQASGLVLPNGVVLAPVGRRIGAYFLSILLVIVTLVIGFLIWGAILWGKGTSPAFSVLGMKVWKPAENRVAGWGDMALRDIVGGIVQGILSFITLLISFILFLTGKEHKTLADMVGGTVVVYDPNKVLEPAQ